MSAFKVEYQTDRRGELREILSEERQSSWPGLSLAQGASIRGGRLDGNDQQWHSRLGHRQPRVAQIVPSVDSEVNESILQSALGFTARARALDFGAERAWLNNLLRERCLEKILTIDFDSFHKDNK